MPATRPLPSKKKTAAKRVNPEADGYIGVFNPLAWQIRPLRDRSRVVLLTGSAGGGKALALDTEVPTTRGWRRMGDLTVGEMVFGADGMPTEIVAATEVLTDRPCYRVDFSSGESVIADAQHQWFTATVESGGQAAVVTTQEMASTLVVGGQVNHSIDTCAPTECRGRHAVVGVTLVASVPVRCIQVAAADGLYLVTRSYIPTHNSRAAGEKLHGFMLKYPGSTGLMIRKSRESMTNSTVIFMDRKVIAGDPRVRHVQTKSRFEYTNGSVLAYGGMYDEKQREQIRSIGQDGSVDIVWVEEANRITEDDFNELLARMRGKAAPWTQILLSCNPDSPSHWIYTRLIQKGEAHVYYSRATDNPHNPASYLESLEALTGVLGLRLRDGKWVQAEGAVYEDYDQAIHLIPALPLPKNIDPKEIDAAGVPKSWRRIRVVDFGYTNPFCCFDDKTEILTPTGWKHFENLGPTEEVGTISPSSHSLEWQVPTDHIEQWYEGLMLVSEPTEQSANFCVTPNHKMVVANRRSGRWRLEEATRLQDLGDSAIPTGWHPIPPSQQPEDVILERTNSRGRVSWLRCSRLHFARFLGLFIAEGCLTEQHVKSLDETRHYIKIAQKTNVSEVRSIISNMGLKWTEGLGRDDVVQFRIRHVALWYELLRLCGKVRSGNKRIPPEVLNWDTDSVRALLSGLMLGDGRQKTRASDGHTIATATYFTSSPKLADDVQALACRLGMATVIHERRVFTGFKAPRTMYLVRFHVAQQATIAKLPLQERDYKGYVRCVTVPNGMLVVRRGGRPMVCGNCQWWAIDPDGRMYRYREIYMSNRTVRNHAHKILELSAGERIEATICDHDAEDRATLHEEGIPTIAARKDISLGIQKVADRLRPAGDGKPRLFLLQNATVEVDWRLEEAKKPTCTEQEFPGYAWPKGGDGKPIREVPVKVDDHGCFVAGTLVETDRGPRPIETIRVGNRVLTTTGYHKVLGAGATGHKPVMALQLSDGRRLLGTGDHPIFVHGQGYSALRTLQYGDTMEVVSPSAPVHVLSVEDAHRSELVYNLTIDAPVGEYFAEGILVHNCDSVRYACMWADNMEVRMATPARTPLERSANSTNGRTLSFKEELERLRAQRRQGEVASHRPLRLTHSH